MFPGKPRTKERVRLDSKPAQVNKLILQAVRSQEIMISVPK
jgi:hypothetical protein